MLQDVQYAWRALRRSPGFAAVAVLSLALGIGAAAALFSLVDAVLLKPLTYREPDHLVFVREVVPPLTHVYPTLPVNYQHLRFWQQEAHSFDSLAAFLSRNSSLGGSEPAPVGGVVATANLFQVLGVDMQLGRGEDWRLMISLAIDDFFNARDFRLRRRHLRRFRRRARPTRHQPTRPSNRPTPCSIP